MQVAEATVAVIVMAVYIPPDTKLNTELSLPAPPENIIIKFADDTVVEGRITGEDETAYQYEILHLEEWFSAQNLPHLMPK